jgi:hypothetical protein
MSKTRTRIGRNEPCPCGSTSKFKYCHGRPENSELMPTIKNYIDSGETPVRWVISNDTGTSFFADKQNRIMVFSDKSLAVQIAKLDIFNAQAPHEINVAGVGPTKWQHLQETLPFLEVPSAEMAAALIQERIEAQQAKYGIESGPTITEDLSHVDSQEEVEQEVSKEGGNASEAGQG